MCLVDVENRTISVRLHQTFPDVSTLDNDTSQCSVLSPTLSIIMVNDLRTVLNKTLMSQFVVDSSVCLSVTSFHTYSQCDYCETRTVIIVSTLKPVPARFQICMSDKPLGIVTSTWLFGLTLNRKTCLVRYTKRLLIKYKEALQLLKSLAGTE